LFAQKEHNGSLSYCTMHYDIAAVLLIAAIRVCDEMKFNVQKRLNFNRHNILALF